MLTAWLENLIRGYAREIESAGQASYRFTERIVQTLRQRPVQEWEADRWVRGIHLGLIRCTQNFFRVGSGSRALNSLFVSNEAGLNVGLRREAVTQAATYVTLITDYGYPRAQTRFEIDWMDVVVYDTNRRIWLYVENKAAASILDRLLRRLTHDFMKDVPMPAWNEEEDTSSHDDALKKAQHIWRNRPRYFWGVSPTARQAFQVQYGPRGFTLHPCALPSCSLQ
jgi:hypothetical protein